MLQVNPGNHSNNNKNKHEWEIWVDEIPRAQAIRISPKHRMIWNENLMSKSSETATYVYNKQLVNRFYSFRFLIELIEETNEKRCIWRFLCICVCTVFKRVLFFLVRRYIRFLFEQHSPLAYDFLWLQPTVSYTFIVCMWKFLLCYVVLCFVLFCFCFVPSSCCCSCSLFTIVIFLNM